MNNYKLYYDCKVYLPSPLYLIPLIICSLGIYLLVNLKNPYVIKKGILICFGAVFTIAGTVSLVVSIIGYAHMYKNVFLEYKKNNYRVVEGEIEHLKVLPFGGNGADQFTVNSIQFEIDGTLSPGYHKRAAKGGIIKSNGVRVKIYYINYLGTNYIMRIEAIDEDYNNNPIVLPPS